MWTGSYEVEAIQCLVFTPFPPVFNVAFLLVFQNTSNKRFVSSQNSSSFAMRDLMQLADVATAIANLHFKKASDERTYCHKHIGDGRKRHNAAFVSLLS